MTDSNDVRALEKISSEIDESQFKIILSSQCIKAQEFLVHRLRKQSEQSRQICNFISNGNLKLESEIRLGEQEIKSLRSALDTIKSANVELKKELLLAKEEKIDLSERINNGIQKYEELWLTSKKRYDNIPLIKKHLQINNMRMTLESSINSLNSEIQNLKIAFEGKEKELANLEKQSIINVVEYMMNERPKILQCLIEKTEEVKHLMSEIKELQNFQENSKSNLNYLKGVDNQIINDSMSVVENTWSDVSKDIDNNNTMLLPKLQLENIDLDILTDRLEQIKKADSDNSVIKRVDSIAIAIDKKSPNKFNQENINDLYVSSYFKNITDIKEDGNTDKSQTVNYAEKKLIHILDDIQLPKTETYNIFSKLNPNEFHDVDVIKANVDLNESKQSQEKIVDSQEVDKMEIIEEIDLTRKYSSNIVVPPIQFLDSSQNSQEKKVTFSTTVSVQNVDNMNTSQEDSVIDITNSEINTSAASDNSYQKIKEKVFKKHNLDLSPQFTYSKNPVTPKIIDKCITSKFFDERNDKTQAMDICRQNINSTVIDSSNTGIIFENKQTQNSSVAGFLFSHGPKGIPESLNVSMTSTCLEDADNEFPHCIDSSLLLSPKADEDMSRNVDKNAVVLSQEVPNFLSGIKKVGFSFFGNSSSENQVDGNDKNPNNNNFNFSFGNAEKKSRGGLFSMFH